MNRTSYIYFYFAIRHWIYLTFAARNSKGNCAMPATVREKLIKQEQFPRQQLLPRPTLDYHQHSQGSMNYVVW